MEKKARDSHSHLAHSHVLRLLSATQWTCNETAWRGLFDVWHQDLIADLWKTFGLVVKGLLGDEQREDWVRLKEKEDERGGGGVLLGSNPKGLPSWSFRSLGERRNRSFFSMWKLEEGNCLSVIQGEIPTNWTNHPSDQSVWVHVCVKAALHLWLETLRREETRRRGF